jgi:hypothetical protein
MFPTSFRPTAAKIAQTLTRAAGVSLIMFGLSSAPAMAEGLLGQVTSTLSNTTSQVLGTCPGQIFSQPFTSLGDYNHYTLVPGSEFNNPPEGWEFQGGASVVSSTLPSGESGAALDLPSGSVAVSAPICVTSAYPTARVYTLDGEGGAYVTVSVSYVHTRSETDPKQVAYVQNAQSGSWAASEAFNIRPKLGGKGEETHELRFVFAAGGSDVHIYGLYVDPWMR